MTSNLPTNTPSTALSKIPKKAALATPTRRPQHTVNNNDTKTPQPHPTNATSPSTAKPSQPPQVTIDRAIYPIKPARPAPHVQHAQSPSPPNNAVNLPPSPAAKSPKSPHPPKRTINDPLHPALPPTAKSPQQAKPPSKTTDNLPHSRILDDLLSGPRPYDLSLLLGVAELNLNDRLEELERVEKEGRMGSGGNIAEEESEERGMQRGKGMQKLKECKKGVEGAMRDVKYILTRIETQRGGEGRRALG